MNTNNRIIAISLTAVVLLAVVVGLFARPFWKATPPNDAIARIMASMTLQDKIGQMVLIDKNSITPDDVRRKSIGGVLSGGGGNPEKNTPEEWYKMVKEFQDAAQDSKLKIPILYGVDAVHGNGNLRGAVIFPHNIGLGATRDAALLNEIGRATAREVRATGANWDFAPVLSMPEDYRWG